MESNIWEGDVTERVIPTENIQLMFHYKKPFVVSQSDKTIVKQPRSIISGLSNTFSDVSTHGETGVVFISFYPNGACQFFKFPLSEIENQSIDLSDMYGSEIRKIEECLYLTNTIKEKVTIIENFLKRKFAPIPSYDNLLLQKSLEILKDRKGQTNANELSAFLYTTPKTLERKFSQYLGKTTKQFIKLIRFQEVLQDFSLFPELNLTEIACKNGYFDQSHFIKDFKTYSGYSPKAFVSKYRDIHTGADYD